MTKTLLALALLAISATVIAGEKRQTRAQCEARCLPIMNDASPQLAAHQQRLKNISAKKNGVTDPQKLKELELEEGIEKDRFEAANEKFCGETCSFFPETL